MAKKKLRVDFSETPKEIRKSGKSKHIPEGDYIAKIVEADIRTSDRTGSRYISWKYQIIKGEHKGVTVYGTTSLKKEALWSLRNLIHAATGKNVAGKALDFDPEKLYGKVVGIAVEDNEYTKDGSTKITSQVSSAFPEEEAEEDDEEEEEEEEEEDDEEDEDLEEVEVDEL